MSKVLYVGFYDILRDGKQIRSYSLAASKKMDFICDVVRDLGHDVEIVSASHITIADYPYTKSKKEHIRDGFKLCLPTSWGANNKLSRIIRVFRARAWLFGYLMKNASKDTPVIVYHNYHFTIPVLLARFFKRFKLILEIEEQYSMVWQLSSFQKWKENLLLKRGTKNSLVVSEVLAEKLNINNPIVSYGNYSAYKGEIVKQSNKDKVVLVYTGSIDKVKGSAFIAMEAMRFLPEKYQLMISGPIAKADESDFYKLLNDINQNGAEQRVEYKGVLDDNAYQQLLLNADIALNPQREGDFGSFLFPSKILTYLSYNLPVVSTNGDSIVKSQVADLILFAENFDGESIANAIQKIDLSQPFESREKLNTLWNAFRTQMQAVLSSDLSR